MKMDKYLDYVNEEENLELKQEQANGIIKIILLAITLSLLLFAVVSIADYRVNNYYDVIYFNDGSKYTTLNHTINIIDGKEVIIDDHEYSWYWVDHIELNKKKGE